MEDTDEVRKILNANEGRKVLGHRFENTELLIRAFTRKAFAKEWKDSRQEVIGHQEPLATLGDAILRAALADIIFGPGEKSSNEITKERVEREKNDKIAEIADNQEFWELIRYGGSEKKNMKQREMSILATTIEAVIGAIYLDVDREFKITKAIIEPWF